MKGVTEGRRAPLTSRFQVREGARNLLAGLGRRVELFHEELRLLPSRAVVAERVRHQRHRRVVKLRSLVIVLSYELNLGNRGRLPVVAGGRLRADYLFDAGGVLVGLLQLVQKDAHGGRVDAGVIVLGRTLERLGVEVARALQVARVFRLRVTILPSARVDSKRLRVALALLVERAEYFLRLAPPTFARQRKPLQLSRSDGLREALLQLRDDGERVIILLERDETLGDVRAEQRRGEPRGRLARGEFHQSFRVTNLFEGAYLCKRLFRFLVNRQREAHHGVGQRLAYQPVE